jgi:undecaprenyl diphosphate synthase
MYYGLYLLLWQLVDAIDYFAYLLETIENYFCSMFALGELIYHWWNKNLAAKLSDQIKPELIPKHLGLILDGNRRFAKKLGASTKTGHALGAKKMREVSRWCQSLGIQHLTIWVFSNENWSRDKHEVDDITDIFLSEAEYQLDSGELLKNGVRLQVIGDYSRFPQRLIDSIYKLEEQTKECVDSFLNICLGYGGRQEILHAVNHLFSTVKPKTLITEDMLGKSMYLAGQPSVDYIIRTSGEQRHSGFLLWDSPYAEYYFSKLLWPAFSHVEFLKSILDFQNRSRRFGK